jgi:hypothetical protein
VTPTWNRIVVQEDVGVIESYANGRLMPGLNIAACDEDVEQVRTGYRCIRCWEPLSFGWPVQCPLCGFPIAAHQAEKFAQVYKGHDPTIRTSAEWDREADMLEDRQERRRFADRAKESGIYLGSRRMGAALARVAGRR